MNNARRTLWLVVGLLVAGATTTLHATKLDDARIAVDPQTHKEACHITANLLSDVLEWRRKNHSRSQVIDVAVGYARLNRALTKDGLRRLVITAYELPPEAIEPAHHGEVVRDHRDYCLGRDAD